MDNMENTDNVKDKKQYKQYINKKSVKKAFKPNQICLFFINGNCKMGDNCTSSHDILQPRKLELCKFYIRGDCEKGNRCHYMHNDYPCKFYHMSKCTQKKHCKFSHESLDPRVLDHFINKSVPETKTLIDRQLTADEQLEKNKEENIEVKKQDKNEISTLINDDNIEKDDENEISRSVYYLDTSNN